MTSWLRRTALALAGLLGTAAAAAQGGASCPPQPSAPSAEQVQAAQAQARDRGLLWRVSKDGRTHHLFGTLHVGRLEWAFPGPQLRAALQDAQAIAFELDPADPAVQASLRTSGAATPRLPPALDAQLQRQLARACIPAQALAGLHPMMQAITAMMVESSRDGLHAAFGQEFALAAAARARGLRTHSLETAERQLAALIPADAALAERQLAATLAQMDSGLARKVLQRLATAWERGELATIEGYAQWCECADTDDERAMLRALNDERNPAMADRIEALHRDGHRLLVAVGALHMTGAKALPALLRERGFAVERVAY
jgi:uncharacterized protein YbaP (TraB family)